jgi:serine/threonine-protein kinase RsbW
MSAPSVPQAPVLRLEARSRIADFGDLARTLSGWCEAQGVPQRTVSAVILVLDELFSNTVNHGYRQDPEGRIVVQAQVVEQEIRVMLTDWAPAFDPLARSLPDTSSPLQERDVGGLGLLFVRRTADTVSYQREFETTPHACNTLRFSKRFAAVAPPPAG